MAAAGAALPGLDVGTIVTIWGPLGLGIVVLGFVGWKLLLKLLTSYEDRIKDSKDAIVSYNHSTIVINSLAEATERQNTLIETQGQRIEKQSATIEKLTERLAYLERAKP